MHTTRTPQAHHVTAAALAGLHREAFDAAKNDVKRKEKKRR